ncbi:uncharacterized protein TNCV_3888791 [Trichonephila clavipes]|nr:uncharacterized protein TNCV_3888791 [Trichonephila clavipes]
MKPSPSLSLAEDENDEPPPKRLTFYIKQLIPMNLDTCLKWLRIGIIEVAARRLHESNHFESSSFAFNAIGSIAYHHLSCYLATLDLNTLSNLNIPNFFLELIGNKREFIFLRKTPKKISGKVPYIFVTSGHSDIPVAIDGTWQKHGHTSLNGAVIVTSFYTGKVLDASILSRFCKRPNKMHNENCILDQFENSGSMKASGAIEIFQLSESLHALRYTKFLVIYQKYGDTKAYKAVNERQPYGDIGIEKLECIGYVEKWMETRLRALKLKMKGKKLSDKKTLDDHGRLADTEIDKLQRYYGLATRNNTNSSNSINSMYR